MPAITEPASAPAKVSLVDHASRDDLRIFLERIARAGQPDVRMLTRGATLAVFGCTQAPEGLTDKASTVLVLRSFALSETPAQPVDLVAPARAVLDRIARLGIIGLTIELPDVTATAAWAGVLPPSTGWEQQGTIDPVSLSNVAEEGMSRIAAALPESPGEPVVRRVRVSVWGSEIAPGVPAAAAFAAESMGFLAAEAPVRVSATRTWRRLSNEHGDVLIRTPLH